MTLDQLDNGEIFAAVFRAIQKQEGLSEKAAYPTADAVAQRLSSSWSSVDRDTVTAARRRRIAAALKKSSQIEEQTDEAIHAAAMKALGELEAQQAEAPPPAAIFAPPRPSRSSASSFIKTVVYWYREDRPFLAFMSIYVLVILVLILLSLRFLVNTVS